MYRTAFGRGAALIMAFNTDGGCHKVVARLHGARFSFKDLPALREVAEIMVAMLEGVNSTE